MADGYQILPLDTANTGKKIDCDVLIVGGVEVYRQRVEVTDPGLLATAANQGTGNGSLANIDSKTPALVGGAVPVSTPAGLATTALQIAGNTSLTSMDAKLPPLSGGAVPVVNATGATSALQTAGNASLSSLDTKTPPANATVVNRSGTITLGGAQQQLMAANAARSMWWVYNPSASSDLWVNDAGNAAVGVGVKVLPGGLYEAPKPASNGAISIFGATTAQAFTAREA